MAVLDAQLYFSALASGDSPSAVADNVSTSYIDQMTGYGLNFFAPGGGAYVAPWVMMQVTTAFTSSGSATIIGVLQDGPDGSTTTVATGPSGTWTDRIVGPTFTVGGATAPTANAQLLAVRLLPTLARYLRVVYRIGVSTMSAGTVISWIMPDQDVVDTSMRKVGTYIVQSGQIAENVSGGILQV